MSTLIPLSFPEEKDIAKHPATRFPYAPLGDDRHHDNQAAGGAHRMQQLEEMLKEVQGRAEIVEKEAYDKAYLAGEKAGIALGKRRGEQILDTLQDSLQDAEASLAVVQDSFAEAAMDVAGFIAKQIIADAVQDNNTILWDIARQAAAQLPDATALTIAVSADDYFAFKRLLEASDSLATLSSDAAVQNGTCRIISSHQDMLVDPVAAVDHWLDTLEPMLHTQQQQPMPEQHSDEH